MKYTIKQFNKDFPDDDACLGYIFYQRYGKNYECPKCYKHGFYKVKERKCYACAWCGCQIHPLANTIFHKSATSLRDWFFAVFLMSTSKNGVSAKEIQRHLGVTYKTAWRIQKQIRKLMDTNGDKLKGTLEIDDAYIGGKRKGKRGRGAEGKTPVLGIVERKGGIQAKVVDNLKASTLLPIIEDNVDKNSYLITDDFSSYIGARKLGLKHDVIKHSIKEYVRNNIHVNTLEGFWSQLKRSINGTYHSVSFKHLQSYVDEFAFRYNYRFSPIPLFEIFLQRAVL